MRDQYFALRDQSLIELDEVQKKFELEVIYWFKVEKKLHWKGQNRSWRMFQKAYQYGAILRIGSKEVRRIVWEKNIGAENLGYASLLKFKEKDVERHPELVEMLWRDEGSLSAQHIKTGLQSESFKIEEIRKPLQLLVTKEEIAYIEH